jgi:Ser/Thr protein kinase RdoA (MazF antagonist)
LPAPSNASSAETPSASEGDRAVTDAALVGRILREYREGGIDPSHVRWISGSASSNQVGYRVDQPDGAAVVVRAYRSDEPLPAYLRGCGTASVLDWLYGRAATLEWLAAQGYPAPRLVPTREGDPLGVAGVWLTRATTYIEGPPLEADHGELSLLGEALGRLHSLNTATAAGAGVGTASWYPETAIPDALERLAAVEALLPGDWRPLHAEFRRTLQTLGEAAGTLPVTVVHGDPWPGNTIRTGEDQVTLIDWENGGLGLPVLDLGYCLLEGHLDPGLPAGDPAAWHIEPDEDRVAALLTGYTRFRGLDNSERHVLGDAIRFATAFAGALHFEQALIDGIHGPSMDTRLSRLRNRLAVSQAVTEHALRHLGEPPSRYAEPDRPVVRDTGA